MSAALAALLSETGSWRSRKAALEHESDQGSTQAEHLGHGALSRSGGG